MHVLITSEHRFRRTPDGAVWTGGVDSYELSCRYLSVFDSLKVVARTLDVGSVDATWRPASGPGVRFVAIPYYVGPRQYLARRAEVQRAIAAAVQPEDAIILRVSSHIAGRLELALAAEGHPYALEVVNDPWEVFAPGAVSHPARPMLRRWFTRQLQRQCRRAAAVAYVTERTLQKRYPCPRYSAGVSDVELPPEAIIATARKPRNQSSDRRRLVTVASLEMMYKAPDTLLRALAELRKSELDLTLEIVGDGRLRPAFERLAAELGVRERVSFRGQLPAGAAVRERLDAADLFILPSRSEGLPRAMVEAMARGLPCIGSNVGGIPELLAPEDLVLPNDVRGLARKIREVLSSPARMAEMSECNLARAQDFADVKLAARRRDFLHYVRRFTAAWANRPQEPAAYPEGEAPVW